MSDDMLGAALAYARMGWKVFPLHGFVSGKCTCGKGCSSPAKHPRTKRGFKDATTDTRTITDWFTRWPSSNIGIATGDGICVVDVDGAEGHAELKALLEINGHLPPTLTSQTGIGLHLVFAERPGAPELRSAARGNVHVRAAGGYIVAPPSKHASGRTYRWIKKVPLAVLPDWLRQWLSGYEISGNRLPAARGPASGDLGHLGPRPQYLQTNQRSLTETASEALRTAFSPAEHARLVSALQAIPSSSYEIWFQVGMALKTLEWERSDGTDIGLELFDAWSQTTPEKYSQGACEDKWRSFGRRQGITIGTIYHLANQHGWSGGAPAPQAQPLGADRPAGLNGHANGAHALPAAFLAAQDKGIFFPDRTENDKAKPTYTNAIVAIQNLGIDCRKDNFREKYFVGGHQIAQWVPNGLLTDDAVLVMRTLIRRAFGFDPNKNNTFDAAMYLCAENQFDSLKDYLNGLKWDGQPRIGHWLQTYMGSADTELNRTIGRLVLIAAVRRGRYPGTKFDQVVVFESKEGKGKSTAIEILAGRNNFSCQTIIGRSDREQQEAMAGVWLYEIADLTGMKKADVEHVKNFVSRTTDSARPAYGRTRVDQDRRTIFFATTNDDEYLKSLTGNRRFWPIPVGHIDLEALRRDRDQLWAEAASYEARGDSIGLPERLWEVAAAEQEARVAPNTLGEFVEKWVNAPGKEKHDVSVVECLVENPWIQARAKEINQTDRTSVAKALIGLGFHKHRPAVEGSRQYRYFRRT